MVNKMDDSFLTYACDVLADTNTGLSGYKIVEYCNSYAIDYNRQIPHATYPFEAQNKRTALRENLQAFDKKEQFNIIRELCELPVFGGNTAVEKMKVQMYQRFGDLADKKISNTVLVVETKHWLDVYPDALKQYKSALTKFESGIFERNTLDDMRLALELQLKQMLNNNKSIENQKDSLGKRLKELGTSAEIRNMVSTMIDYYAKFQDDHVKHNDKVNPDEIEYIIDLTSVIMKFLAKKYNGGQN